MKKNIHPAFVLGAGLNALGIARSLGKHQIPVIVMDTANKDVAYSSRYVIVNRLSSDLSPNEWIEIINKHAQEYDRKPVLFITSDRFLRLVAKHRDQFQKYFIFDLSETDVLEKITDKSRFTELATTHNWPIATTYLPKSMEDILAIAQKINYPVLFKPALSYEWFETESVKKQVGGKKIITVENPDELVSCWKKIKDTSRALLVQEVIPGEDDQLYHYYSYRDVNNQELVGNLVARRLRIYPINGGVGAFVQAVTNPKLAAIGRQLLSTINFVGASSICFKKDANTGEFKIFEINARLPMNHTVFQMCGVDLPYVMYKNMLREDVLVPKLKNLNTKWMSLSFDSRSVWSYWRAGQLTLPSWLSSLRGTKMCAEFARDDLKPFFFTIGKVISAAWQQNQRS